MEHVFTEAHQELATHFAVALRVELVANLRIWVYREQLLSQVRVKSVSLHCILADDLSCD